MIAFPSTPDIGDIHTYAKRSWIWNGNAWQSSNYRPDGAIVADIAPANPESGWMWWDRINSRLFVWNGAAWVEPNTSTTYLWDADAADYITRVETTEASYLEKEVRYAINEFVIDCKNDGNWDAIKSSCILAGARTLEGALVPLVGSAPTNAGFVSLDYDRKIGLKGDGAGKHLLSNRSGIDDPEFSRHISFYVTERNTINYRWYMGSRAAGGGLVAGYTSNTIRMYGASTGYLTKSHTQNGFYGITKYVNSGGSNVYNARTAGSTTSATVNADAAPAEFNIPVFAAVDSIYSVTSANTNSRLSFYSIGEELNDMTAFDITISALMAKLQTAIT
jgi:hypothetical protein